MTTIEVTELGLSFDARRPPAAYAESGDVVRFTTPDTTFRRIESGEPLEDADYETLNFVAGPVHLRGAAPGDSLDVEILNVEIASAWVVWMQGFGPLGGEVDGVGARQVLTGDGDLDLGDGLRIPLDPMVGCIGVAPVKEPASTLRPVYPTGGESRPA